MKITADMLTEEMGFVKGCIVMVNGVCGHYNMTGAYSEGFIVALILDEFRPFKIDEIESIKVLTGPMSIWNHAPKFADYLIYNLDKGQEWYSKDSYPNSMNLLVRPWWAK